MQNLWSQLQGCKQKQCFESFRQLTSSDLEKITNIELANVKNEAISISNVKDLDHKFIVEEIMRLPEWKKHGPRNLYSYTDASSGTQANYQLITVNEKSRFIFSTSDQNVLPRFALVQSLDKVKIDRRKIQTPANEHSQYSGHRRSFKEFHSQNTGSATKISILLSESPSLSFCQSPNPCKKRRILDSASQAADSGADNAPGNGWPPAQASLEMTPNISESALAESEGSESQSAEMDNNSQLNDSQKSENPNNSIHFGHIDTTEYEERYSSRVVMFEDQKGVMAEIYSFHMGAGVVDFDYCVTDVWTCKNGVVGQYNGVGKTNLMIKLTKDMAGQDVITYAYFDGICNRTTSGKQWSSFAKAANQGQDIFNGAVPTKNKKAEQCIEYLMAEIVIPKLQAAGRRRSLKSEVRLGIRTNSEGTDYMLLSNAILDCCRVHTIEHYQWYLERLSLCSLSSFQSGFLFDTELSAVYYNASDDSSIIPTLASLQSCNPPSAILRALFQLVVGSKYYWKYNLITSFIGYSRLYKKVQAVAGGFISIELTSPPGLFKSTLIQSGYKLLGVTHNSSCGAKIRDGTDAAKRKHQDAWTAVTRTEEDLHLPGLQTAFGDRDTQITGNWGGDARITLGMQSSGKPSQFTLATSNKCTINLDREEVTTRALVIHFLPKDKPQKNHNYNKIRKEIDAHFPLFSMVWYGIPVSKRDMLDMMPTALEMHKALAKKYQMPHLTHDRLYQSSACILAYIRSNGTYFWGMNNSENFFFKELSISAQKMAYLCQKMKQQNISYEGLRRIDQCNRIVELCMALLFTVHIVNGLNATMTASQELLKGYVVIHDRRIGNTGKWVSVLSFRVQYMSQILDFFNELLAVVDDKSILKHLHNQITTADQFKLIFLKLRAENRCITSSQKDLKCCTYQLYLAPKTKDEKAHKPTCYGIPLTVNKCSTEPFISAIASFKENRLFRVDLKNTNTNTMVGTVATHDLMALDSEHSVNDSIHDAKQECKDESQDNNAMRSSQDRPDIKSCQHKPVSSKSSQKSASHSPNKNTNTKEQKLCGENNNDSQRSTIEGDYSIHEKVSVFVEGNWRQGHIVNVFTKDKTIWYSVRLDGGLNDVEIVNYYVQKPLSN